MHLFPCPYYSWEQTLIVSKTFINKIFILGWDSRWLIQYSILQLRCPLRLCTSFLFIFSACSDNVSQRQILELLHRQWIMLQLLGDNASNCGDLTGIGGNFSLTAGSPTFKYNSFASDTKMFISVRHLKGAKVIFFSYVYVSKIEGGCCSVSEPQWELFLWRSVFPLIKFLMIASTDQ